MSKKKKTSEELLNEAMVLTEEQPYEVPENWVWVKSEFVAKWGSGGTPSRKKSEYYNGNIPWLKTGELRDTIIFDAEEKITEEGLKKSSAKLFPKNSVAIAMYGATIGKLGILGIDATTNQACAVGTPYFVTNSKFMFYYFLSQRKNLIEMGKGGAQPNISQAIIKEFPYPLPTLNEQKRIVEKVERLLEKIEEATMLIEEAKETFQLRRAAILDKAFRGELGTNDVNEESVAEFINKNSSINDDKAPYQVPRNWRWYKLSELFEQIKEQIEPTGKEKYIGLEHLNKGGGVLEIGNTEGVKSTKVLFKSEDVLYGKLRPYLNKHAHVNFEGVASTDIIIFRSKYNDGMLNKLLDMYLGLPRVVSYANENSSGINLPRVSPKIMGELPFPCPPFNEQKRIVEKIDKLLTNLEYEQEMVGNAINKLDLIKQSILSKGFRGELGTNDPTEENAIELLKEVLQEKIK